MAKKKSTRKNDVSATASYPSRAKLANISSTKDINAALQAIADEVGDVSIAWVARRAINVYLKLRPLDSLLQRIRPEHLERIREALEEIVEE